MAAPFYFPFDPSGMAGAYGAYAAAPPPMQGAAAAAGKKAGVKQQGQDLEKSVAKYKVSMGAQGPSWLSLASPSLFNPLPCKSSFAFLHALLLFSWPPSLPISLQTRICLFFLQPTGEGGSLEGGEGGGTRGREN